MDTLAPIYGDCATDGEKPRLCVALLLRFSLTAVRWQTCAVWVFGISDLTALPPAPERFFSEFNRFLFLMIHLWI